MKQTNSSLHTVLLALLLEGGHLGPVPSQNAASRHPLSSRHLTPYLNWHDSVQHGPCTTHICWFFNFFIKYNCKYLRRWASGRRPQSTRPLSGLLDTAHGETALFLAIFLPSTIAFFARFHHSVAANCTLGLFFFLEKKNKKVLLYRRSIGGYIPVKQPCSLRALALRTPLMLLRLQGENLLLFLLSPEVARANMM